MGTTEMLVDVVRTSNSNPVTKPPTTTDSQYMQKPNRVFVFFTELANKSAESVMKGEYGSIIEYHCAQPETKKYLIDTISQMNGNNQLGHMKPPLICSNNILPGNVSLGPGQPIRNSGMLGSMGLNQVGMMHGNMPPMKCQPQSLSMDMMANANNQDQIMSKSMLLNSIGNFSNDQFPLSARSQPQGIMKNPDVNLSPSQRLRREDKIAHIKKIGELLMKTDTQQHTSQHHGMNSEISPTSCNPINVDNMLTKSYGEGKSNDGGVLKQSTNIGPNKVDTPKWQNMPSSFFDDRDSPVSGPSPTASLGNANIELPGQSIGRRMRSSPKSKQKEGKMCTNPMPGEFSPPVSGQQSPDGIYSRSLQSLARQQQQHKQQPPLPHTQAMASNSPHCKEPPMMPVPSPQHIPYLSSFDGQELIIQKQPNISLKDSSPTLSQAGLDTIIPSSADSSCSRVIVSEPNASLTPSSLDLDSSKYPVTPSDFGVLSPAPETKSHLRGNSCVNQMKNDLRFSCNSPQMLDHQQQQRFQSTPTTNFMSQTTKNTYLDTMSSEKTFNVSGESKEASPCSAGSFPRGTIAKNVPIDPTAAPKPSFDPISSLAQLTNNVPVSQGGQPGMMHSPNMMPYNSGSGPSVGHMNMIQMNDLSMNHPSIFNPQMPADINTMIGNPGNRIMCPNNMVRGGTPKPDAYPPTMSSNALPARVLRPVRPGPGPGLMSGSCNNANVQVKPSAPNTIQYLPNINRPPVGGSGRTNVDFLRYQNPNSGPPNQPSHNINYFQCGYSGSPPAPHLGHNMNETMSNMSCGMSPGNPMIRPVMRGANPSCNMMRLGNSGNMPMQYNEQMYPSNSGQNMNLPNNCHMFAGGGVKMSPMGMSRNIAPDATQPLPPSMGQANNFKNNSFMGQPLELSDPQYQVQYANFQQQLYATNTRGGHANNQSMPSSNQQYFISK